MVEDRDPWSVLGISPGSNPEEIRRAFRRLARRFHPDRGPADPDAPRRFREIVAAVERLTGRAAAAGAGAEAEPIRSRPGAGRTGRGGAVARWGAEYQRGLEDARREAAGSRDGASAEHPVSPREALRGAAVVCRIRVARPCILCGASPSPDCPRCAGSGREETKHRVRITIPAGSRPGDRIVLPASVGGRDAAPGSRPLSLRLSVAFPPDWRLDGLDLHLDVQISTREAEAGTVVRVATPTGPVRVTVPAGSGPRTRLRLAGHGWPAPLRRGGPPGDLILHPRVVARPVRPTDPWSPTT